MLSGHRRLTLRPFVTGSVAPLAGLALLGLLVAACSRSSPSGLPRRTTTSPPTVPTTTAAPTTTTTEPVTFPAVIVEAMAQFTPLAAGARAPIRLPAVDGYVTAQTGGLGGQDNVTLIVTKSPMAVNSPTLSSAGAGRELASFSTTPTASPSNASGELARARSQSLASCEGPSTAMSLSGGVAATTCPTLEGAAINWTVGNWAVQVLTLDGTSPSTAEADHMVGLLTPAALPQSDAGGIVSVVVPRNPSAGSADTAAFEWTLGSDVYQVRSSDDPDSAVAVAGAMRPYPG